MRVALVGGAGFVGHHLALDLKARGHEIQIIDSLTVNNLHSQVLGSERWTAMLHERFVLLERANIPHIRIDATDYHQLSAALREWAPDLIVHLAAVAHIDRSDKDPWSTFKNSVITLQKTIDVARALDAGVIYFSSSTVYGNFTGIIDEDYMREPYGNYGTYKWCGEGMCKSYNQSYGMPVVIIRPQALYGARCVSQRVTQKFVERAHDGLALTIHGSGSEEHDFTYIDDLIQGLRLVIEKLEFKPGLFRIYNVTGECATSLNALADIITERFPTKVEYGEPDPLKPTRGTMSCKRIREELGYEPKFDIRRGMNAYMDYYQGLESVGKVA